MKHRRAMSNKASLRELSFWKALSMTWKTLLVKKLKEQCTLSLRFILARSSLNMLKNKNYHPISSTAWKCLKKPV